jgi:hypothetical protein
MCKTPSPPRENASGFYECHTGNHQPHDKAVFLGDQTEKWNGGDQWGTLGIYLNCCAKGRKRSQESGHIVRREIICKVGIDDLQISAISPPALALAGWPTLAS